MTHPDLNRLLFGAPLPEATLPPDQSDVDLLLFQLAPALLAPLLERDVLASFLHRLPNGWATLTMRGNRVTEKQHRAAMLASPVFTVVMDRRFLHLPLTTRLADLPNQIRRTGDVFDICDVRKFAAEAYPAEEMAVLGHDMYWTALVAVWLETAVRQLAQDCLGAKMIALCGATLRWMLSERAFQLHEMVANLSHPEDPAVWVGLVDEARRRPAPGLDLARVPVRNQEVIP